VTTTTAPLRAAGHAAAAPDLPEPLRPSPDVRSAGDEHLVLLDLASSHYYMLNRTGARVWRGLEQGLALQDVVARLAAESADGDEEPNHREVRREVAELTRFLLAEGLLIRDGSGPRTHASAAAAHPRKAGAPVLRRPPSVFAAWWAVAYVDLVASLFGIRRLLRLLPACPPRAPHAAAGDELDATVAATVAAVDHAASFHLRKAWCLARSAACTWLLRRRAVPAHLVLGVRPLPFFAHAWVEVDGRVVNDADRVRQLAVLDRF
jgi:hypothetical protein